jgi:uncharacterized membrane protein YhaH (DUF805 family)
MKCEACGTDNIYGSKACKACGASLVRAESGAASPAPAPAPVAAPAPAPAPAAAPVQSALVAQPLPSVQPEPVQAAESASGTQELGFIPYTGNEQFNHFILGLRLSLDFKGRTGRAGFWYFTLFQVLILIVLQMVSPTLADLTLLITLVPTLSIWFRRLHDTGRSGLWLLVSLIPVVGLVLFYFAAQAGKPEANAWGPGAVAHN